MLLNPSPAISAQFFPVRYFGSKPSMRSSVAPLASHCSGRTNFVAFTKKGTSVGREGLAQGASLAIALTVAYREVSLTWQSKRRSPNRVAAPMATVGEMGIPHLA